MQTPKTGLMRGEATRKAILDAAERVFAELGFSTARLEDVAAAVGIRRASLVYYFRGKQELYDAVETGIFADLQAETEQRLQGLTDPWARVEAVIDSWLDFMVARPTAARLITRNIADIAPRASNPVEFSETTLATIEALVEEGQAAGVFGPIRPLHVVNIVGAGVLQFVCNASQYGRARAYRPDDPDEIATYRQLLHDVTRTLLKPRGEVS